MDEALARILLPGSGVDEEGLERLFGVASRVGALTHRNLAGLLLAGRDDEGRCHLRAELPGELTLAGELQDLGPEPMYLPRAMSLLAQLADGLGDAHDAGVSHGDLSPDQVGFGPTKPQDVVVQLHGVGRLALLEAAGLLPHGTGDLVSPAYASPEQHVGEPHVGEPHVGESPGHAGASASAGASADVYSLGVLAFRLCTGRLPFECATRSLYRAAHRDSTPPAPRDRRPSYVAPLPEGVDALILSCLEKDPQDRPTAGEVSGAMATAACEAARRALSEQRSAGPLGGWKRIRDKAVETARYVEYVRLSSEPMAEALKAFAPHDARQRSLDRAAEEAGAQWDEQHGEGQGRVHRLRRAALALGLDHGRLVARGAQDQPGARDLAGQIDELLRSVVSAQGEAQSALQAATAELIRAHQEATDWGGQVVNRVMALVDTLRERRSAAGDPAIHQRIDDLMDLVAQTDGTTVPTLPGH